MTIKYLIWVVFIQINYGTSLTPEQQQIHDLVVDHVLNQANIPVSFRMEAATTPFIGRTSELSELQWSHVDEKIVILTGPHGVGKSELAKKYAENFKVDNVSSTLWINSESHVTVIHAFRHLAVTIGISTENKEDTTIIQDVITHFKSRKTLIIFDAAKYDNIFVANMPLWIGDSKFINVIVTSRDTEWDETKYRIIDIKPFTQKEATQYIKLTISKDINLVVDDESCKELAELLKFNPLALTDAARDIVKKNSNPDSLYTIQNFIQSYVAPGIPITGRPPTEQEITDAIKDKIKKEWERMGDSITDEAKRAGSRIAKEAERTRVRVKSWFAFKF